MTFPPLFLILLFLVPWLGACAGGRSAGPRFTGSPYVDPDSLKKDEIVHIPTGVSLSRAELFRFLQCDRVVYVGEGHDNIYDHRVELEVIRELVRRRPGRVVVGFEMLAAVHQAEIDDWLAGRASDDDFIRLFAADWGVRSYPYYREIFNYLKREKIPIRALNVSREEKAALMGGMAAGENGQKAASSGPADGIADPYQEKALRAMFAGHAEGHGRIDLFLKVHHLWEETMAKNIAAYLESPAGADRMMVVLTGEFHVARGYGLPRQVFQRLKEPYAVLLTTTPPGLYESRPKTMHVDFPELPLYLGDFFWCVPYRNLDDRLVRLGVGIKPAKPGPGLEIVMVAPDSPAARAGLEVGDRLLRLADAKLTDPLSLSLLLLDYQPGDRVGLTIERGQRRLRLEARLEAAGE